MPLAITNKSPRLLATPSPRIGSTPQLPTFYPPSYYAAAASGVHYSSVHQAQRKENKPPSTLGDQTDNASHYEQFMPMSYPPGSSSSESSFEFRSPRSSRQTHAASHLAHAKLVKREKRQSQIAGLPQIEAQLLPSLRDTVDRMTRPPSFIATSRPVATKIPHNFSRGLHGPGLETRPGHPAHDKQYPSEFSSNAHEIHRTQRIREPSPANVPEDIQSNPAVTSPVKPKYPKSALRTPTQSSYQGDETPRLNVIPSSNTRGTSLRSVKSILRRKLSISSTITAPPKGSPKKSILKGTLKSKQSPTLPATYSSSTSNLPHSNNTNHSPIQYKGPPPRSHPGTSITPRSTKHFVSNIPRPRARFAAEYTEYRSSDSSDPGNRREWESRDQRRLTVINADIPSSSGSDCDSDNSGSTVESYSRIGLGLDYSFPEASIPSTELGAGEYKTWSDRSVERTPRTSVISSGSSNFQYSDGREPPVQSMATDEYERRRAALLNIVSTLDQTAQRRTTQQSDNSDYHGEQGFAYSDMGDMNVLPSTSHKPPLAPQLVDINRTDKNNQNRHSQYVSVSPPLSILGDPSETVPHGDSGKRPIGEIGAATARLARRSLMIATREREAFGLKPSDSEIYHHQYEHILHHPDRDSHISESSTGEPDRHQVNNFSDGASSMLQSIQAKRGSLKQFGNDREIRSVASPKGSPPVSLSNTASSGPGSQSPIETDTFEQLRVTEQSFVKNLQTCVQHYVLPLRKHGSKTWISGVPARISRFLDWLEDILHLHEQILEILHRHQDDIVRQLLFFLPRFEIYQPYVARLACMYEELQLLMDEGSDFGCFVDLQDKQNRDTGWTLRRYISEPEDRLQKYLELFSALLELTARECPQYILVFSLLRSMELIVDVIHTVKREEEDHRRNCALLRRFHGPRPLTLLADRTRSILWHGPLILHRAPPERGISVNILKGTSRTRRLSRAITSWDAKRSTPGPNLEVPGSQESISSYETESTYSSSDEDSAFPPTSDWRLLGPGSTGLRSTAVPVYAIVFSDLVLFGGRASDVPDSHELLSDIGQEDKKTTTSR